MEAKIENVAEPTVIAGRYRLGRALGEGASGVVRVAEDTESGQRVALKVIHRHLVRDRQISRRFHREASILRKLRCENLVPLLDFGEDQGLLYMALELVEGRPLDELMREGPLAIERGIELVAQVCAALECAHAAGVVHRDLKPGNVIVERTPDGRERARVLDFGMAKVLRGDGSDSLTALTEQNMVFGTPEYMAPEQARGDEVDARCDVYAAGVILYELLTGSVPFESNTPIGTMTAHLVETPAPPSSRAPGRPISKALEGVVLHALAKAPRDRYPSAASLAGALERATEHPSDVTSIAPPPAHDDADLGTRDTETALKVSAAGPPDPPRAPATAPPARRLWLWVALVAAVVGILLGVILSLVSTG
jgi:eukaryotic-like serine/threonine-protein kinase